MTDFITAITGTDLSKNFAGGQPIMGEKVVITDESIGLSQLLGVRVWDAPQHLRLWTSS